MAAAKRAVECAPRYAAIGGLTFVVEYFYLARVFPMVGVERVKRSFLASLLSVSVVFTTDVIFRVADEY